MLGVVYGDLRQFADAIPWHQRSLETIENMPESDPQSKGYKEFKKASGILGGLWEKVREHKDEFLDRRIVEAEGLDVAAKDFVAGMTDRYAVSLYERLFIPKPWVGPLAADR